MEYEIYQKKLTSKQFFNTWKDDLEELTQELKDIIYEKYLMKQEVFIRDMFTCQNVNCPFCKNKKYHNQLTVHHIKGLRNGGKNIARNGITLCNTIHKGYERAKHTFTLSKSKLFPAHMRGMTYKLSREEIINWKKVRSEMRQFRKTLKEYYGIAISWEQFEILMKFLERNFSD